MSQNAVPRDGNSATSQQRLSDLIGLIYDCAIEPQRWPATLAEICSALRCKSGSLLLADLQTSRHRFAYTWGFSDEFSRRYFEYADVLNGFFSLAFSRHYCQDGEPLVMSTILPHTGPRGEQIYAELTRPEGIVDMMQTVVLRETRRIAVFGASRHDGAGVLADDDLDLMRLLAPHIRRSVTIIDILDAVKIESQTLAATLDTFAAGVVVVADRGRIIHANDAARRMLAAREPIMSGNGCLAVRNGVAGQELASAISRARTEEATIKGSGIGVPLRDEGPSVAHVLPLARGDLRTRLMPQATAAVFVSKADSFASGDLEALARSFDLTPAELRILGRLVGGATLNEAARTLSIGRETARTHLAHIFAKTGMRRQAELLALVSRLVPPVHRQKS